MAARKLKLKRTSDQGQQRYEALLRMVDQRVMERLEDIDSRQRAIEAALHTIAVILKDLRNSAILADQEGSTSKKVEMFLESFDLAMNNRSILEENLEQIEEWRVALQSIAMAEGEIETLSDDMVELLSQDAEEEDPLSR